MGSGIRRRKVDSYRINTPMKGGLGGAGISGSRNEGGDSTDENIICPPSFRVKLNNSKNIKNGMSISLVEENGTIFILAFGDKVGKLRSQQAEIVNRCSLRGLIYRGVAEVKDDINFGIFQRYES